MPSLLNPGRSPPVTLHNKSPLAGFNGHFYFALTSMPCPTLPKRRPGSRCSKQPLGGYCTKGRYPAGGPYANFVAPKLVVLAQWFAESLQWFAYGK